MKNYYQIYIWQVICLFGFACCFLNCENDTELQIIDEVTSNSGFHVTQIEYPKFIDNPSIETQLKSFNLNSTANKVVSSSDDSIVIDTDFVSYIESDDGLYHSFTFPILQEDDDTKLKNLLMSLQEDGTYKLIYIAYTLNNGEIDLDQEIEMVTLQDENMVNEILDKTTRNCVWILSEWCSYNNADHPGGYQAEGQKCPGYSNATSQECVSGSGSDNDETGDSGTGSDSSDTGQGGSGGANGDNSNDVTIPTTKPQDELNCGSIPDEIKAELISVFGAGNFEKNCDIDINDPDVLRFNSLEELEEFAQNAFNSESENSSNDINDQNERTAIFEFDDWLFSYNFRVKQQLGIDHETFIDYGILEVTSGISGITLSLSYEQLGWEHQSVSVSGSRVGVDSKISVNLIYKEFGQVVTKHLKCELVMDPIDGSPISGTLEEL